MVGELPWTELLGSQLFEWPGGQRGCSVLRAATATDLCSSTNQIVKDAWPSYAQHALYVYTWYFSTTKWDDHVDVAILEGMDEAGPKYPRSSL